MYFVVDSVNIPCNIAIIIIMLLLPSKRAIFIRPQCFEIKKKGNGTEFYKVIVCFIPFLVDFSLQLPFAIRAVFRLIPTLALERW